MNRECPHAAYRELLLHGALPRPHTIARRRLATTLRFRSALPIWMRTEPPPPDGLRQLVQQARTLGPSWSR